MRDYCENSDVIHVVITYDKLFKRPKVQIRVQEHCSNSHILRV